MSSSRSATHRLRRAPPSPGITRALPLVLALLTACLDSSDPVAPLRGAHTPDRLIVTTPGVFTQIDNGFFHTCALRSDGVAECWGYNADGQAPATRAPLTGHFTSIVAEGFHTCGLRSDGVVECWGGSLPNYGQAPSVQTATTGLFTAIGLGTHHSCAVRSDGVAECWGRNWFGEAPPTRAPTSGAFTHLAGGFGHTCGLRSDGVVECWGSNNAGQAPPVKTAVIGMFTQLSSGKYYHACALRSDGVVECWGSNFYGEAPPLRAAIVGAFTEVAAGSYHTCGLRSDGVAECWGYNARLQAPATRAATTGTFTTLASGDDYTCGLRSDGVAECWGINDQGGSVPIRAPNSSTTRILPTASFTAPTQVTAGQSFVLTMSGAHVPGHPEATTFSYAFDCGDGAGYMAPTSTPNATCATSVIGSRTVLGKVIDQDGDFAEYTATVELIWPFTGFYNPVSNPPALNVAKAGSTTPLKFGLGGDYGLNVIAAGYPIVNVVSCTTGALLGTEPAIPTGGSALKYNAETQAYAYLWKSARSWRGTCRQVIVKLIDGTYHQANFSFN